MTRVECCNPSTETLPDRWPSTWRATSVGIWPRATGTRPAPASLFLLQCEQTNLCLIIMALDTLITIQKWLLFAKLIKGEQIISIPVVIVIWASSMISFHKHMVQPFDSAHSGMWNKMEEFNLHQTLRKQRMWSGCLNVTIHYWLSTSKWPKPTHRTQRDVSSLFWGVCGDGVEWWRSERLMKSHSVYQQIQFEIPFL